MLRWVTVVIFAVCLAVPYSALATQRVGGGDITFSPKNASPVVFSHEKHVQGKGLKCSGCHYSYFPMSQGASMQMDMSKINKGDFCGKCHNGVKSFDVKVPGNCVRCHK